MCNRGGKPWTWVQGLLADLATADSQRAVAVEAHAEVMQRLQQLYEEQVAAQHQQFLEDLQRMQQEFEGCARGAGWVS